MLQYHGTYSKNTRLRLGMIEGFHMVDIIDIFINEAWAINENPYYCLTSNE
jgi:hypothetical protein